MHPPGHPALQPERAALLEAPTATPIPRLALQKSSHRAQVALVSQKVGLFCAFGPELDGVGEGVHGLWVAPDKTAAKVNVGQAVDLALQKGELADVI